MLPDLLSCFRICRRVSVFHVAFPNLRFSFFEFAAVIVVLLSCFVSAVAFPNFPSCFPNPLLCFGFAVMFFLGFFYFSVVFPNMLQCSRFCCRVFTVSEIALVFSVFFKRCAFVFVCLLLFFCSLLLVLLLCLLFYSRGSGFVVFFRLCRFCFLMRSCVLARVTSMCFAPTGHRIRPLKSVLFMPLCSPPTKPVLVCPAITHTHTKRL